MAQQNSQQNQYALDSKIGGPTPPQQATSIEITQATKSNAVSMSSNYMPNLPNPQSSVATATYDQSQDFSEASRQPQIQSKISENFQIKMSQFPLQHFSQFQMNSSKPQQYFNNNTGVHIGTNFTSPPSSQPNFQFQSVPPQPYRQPLPSQRQMFNDQNLMLSNSNRPFPYQVNQNSNSKNSESTMLNESYNSYFQLQQQFQQNLTLNNASSQLPTSGKSTPTYTQQQSQQQRNVCYTPTSHVPYQFQQNAPQQQNMLHQQKNQTLQYPQTQMTHIQQNFQQNFSVQQQQQRPQQQQQHFLMQSFQQRQQSSSQYQPLKQQNTSLQSISPQLGTQIQQQPQQLQQQHFQILQQQQHTQQQQPQQKQSNQIPSTSQQPIMNFQQQQRIQQQQIQQQQIQQQQIQQQQIQQQQIQQQQVQQQQIQQQQMQQQPVQQQQIQQQQVEQQVQQQQNMSKLQLQQEPQLQQTQMNSQQNQQHQQQNIINQKVPTTTTTMRTSSESKAIPFQSNLYFKNQTSAPQQQQSHLQQQQQRHLQQQPPQQEQPPQQHNIMQIQKPQQQPQAAPQIIQKPQQIEQQIPENPQEHSPHQQQQHSPQQQQQQHSPQQQQHVSEQQQQRNSESQQISSTTATLEPILSGTNDDERLKNLENSLKEIDLNSSSSELTALEADVEKYSNKVEKHSNDFEKYSNKVEKHSHRVETLHDDDGDFGERSIMDKVEKVFQQADNMASDCSTTSIHSDNKYQEFMKPKKHHNHHHHHHHKNDDNDDATGGGGGGGGDDENDEEEEEDNDDDDDDDGGEDDDDDDEYSTEDTSSGSSENPAYDLEGQGYFDDISVSKNLADTNHKLHTKAESLRDGKVGTRKKFSDTHQQSTNGSKGYKSSSCHGNLNLNSSFNRAQFQANCNKCIDLLREKNLIPETGSEVNLPPMQDDFVCDPEVMCCTLNVIPNTPSLLAKSRLPLAVHIHPLKDCSDLPIIKVGSIVRCRLCRMYINPYVNVIDRHRWKCCMCSRFNDLPEDFTYDMKRRTYTDGRHRPEMNSSSYEIVAPLEYASGNLSIPAYLFVMDVSFNAVETDYLTPLCQNLIDNLDSLCANDNVLIGIMTFNTHVHFYDVGDDLSKPQVYDLPDIDNLFIPRPNGLLVNLKRSRSLLVDLLTCLPSMHKDNKEIGSCMGSAAKIAFELMEPIGGRVTIFQTKIPDVGEGCLKCREDPNKRAAETVQNLTPATDFYKRLALDGSSSRVAFDLFMLNTQYADLATLASLTRFSGGALYYFPNYHYTSNPVESMRFDNTLDRYFTMDVGFEAVLRLRCTRGLNLQLFHGNGFVRSIDLLALSTVTPDLSYTVQIQMDDTIEDTKICLQAALLYTNNKFERRIRVHTICLPITTYLSDVFTHANQLAITALVAKMAVDRSISSTVIDSREALTHVALDMLNAYGENLSNGQRDGQLPCSYFLRALPLYILSLLKSIAFRLGVSTKLDDRSYALDLIKTQPWHQIIKFCHPNLYPLHMLSDKNALCVEDQVIPQSIVLPLSAGCIDKQGAYLLDDGCYMYLWMSPSINRSFLRNVIGANRFGDVIVGLYEFPQLENPWSENVRNFVEYLQNMRGVTLPIILIRDDHADRVTFYERLIEDRTSDVINMSYIEFIRNLHSRVTY